MTASHQITPSQARFQQEHRERRARIAALARPDTPILCLSASARSRATSVPRAVLPELVVQAPVAEWAQRQIQRYQPWFEIEEVEPGITIRPQLLTIMRICGLHHDISINDLKSSRRTALVVKCRQIAMFLCKEMTLRSLPEIGRFFGGRDHTTVLHSIRKIARLESQNITLADDLNVLRQRIRGAD